MIISNNCKINLSLALLKRREDGFTEIETIMFPIGGGLCDIVEMIESSEFEFSAGGIAIDCPPNDNLCVKAFQLMQKKFNLPNAKVHLYKQIPFGAGLGAGSANAVAVLKLCNNLFELNQSNEQLECIAAELGSDTAFFVKNQSAIARGRGELISPIEIDLRGYYILLVKPNVGVSTKEAYSMITPRLPDIMPSEAIQYPVREWHRVLKNDFEESIFEKLPVLSIIKGEMYRQGALYASMSGSGSTIYGIFDNPPAIKFPHFSHCYKVEYTTNQK